MTPESTFRPELRQEGSLTPHFVEASGVEPSSKPGGHKRKTKPFCVRLTEDERRRLERAAGREPLGSYIRSRLLEGQPARRRPQRRAVADDVALARVLGRLGQSRLASSLNQLAEAAHIGALPVTPEVAAEVRQACAEVRAMRRDLLRALGLQESGGP